MPKLTLDEVKRGLCYYDPRNPESAAAQYPDYEEAHGPYDPAKRCSCDNCFYGRTRLALALLECLEVSHA